MKALIAAVTILGLMTTACGSAEPQMLEASVAIAGPPPLSRVEISTDWNSADETVPAIEVTFLWPGRIEVLLGNRESIVARASAVDGAMFIGAAIPANESDLETPLLISGKSLGERSLAPLSSVCSESIDGCLVFFGEFLSVADLREVDTGDEELEWSRNGTSETVGPAVSTTQQPN